MTIGPSRKRAGSSCRTTYGYRYEARISQRPSALARHLTATNPGADSRAVQANPDFNERGQQSTTSKGQQCTKAPTVDDAPWKSTQLMRGCARSSPSVETREEAQGLRG